LLYEQRSSGTPRSHQKKDQKGQDYREKYSRSRQTVKEFLTNKKSTAHAVGFLFS
jgi:hypothetical protein